MEENKFSKFKKILTPYYFFFKVLLEIAHIIFWYLISVMPEYFLSYIIFYIYIKYHVRNFNTKYTTDFEKEIGSK